MELAQDQVTQDLKNGPVLSILMRKGSLWMDEMVYIATGMIFGVILSIYLVFRRTGWYYGLTASSIDSIWYFYVLTGR